MIKNLGQWVLISLWGMWLTACATAAIAPAMQVQALPEAITVPYRISSEGRFIVDVAVNDSGSLPFALDTGATVSTIYDDTSKTIGLNVSDDTILIRGLIASGRRPAIKNVAFQIGSKSFPLKHIALLEVPKINDEAAGLLGTDILGDHTALFNKDTMIATFVPSKYIEPKTFQGWRRIKLKTQIDSYPNSRLHFTEVTLDRTTANVLIDTGANSNFINWRLATLDKSIRQMERTLRKEGRLQGALDSTALKTQTTFYDLSLGEHYWKDVTVIVRELNTLSNIAPVDEPIMIAGANMFSPRTVAFDLGGNTIYIRPNPDDPRPPPNNRP